MATEAMLEMPAMKIGKQNPQIPKPGENLFFVTREATGESNRRALGLIAKVADQFPMDSVIKKEISDLRAQIKKDPAILMKMTSTIGVEQIA
ncbi:MAG: hypothetical protein WC263_00575 [Candidatus Micrarchaeia archaeon]|jgi:hypothetical protein